MKPVLIVGSGISGLSTAFWLHKEGIPCEVIDVKDHPGGLIATEKTPFGPAEKAANGFMAAVEMCSLCDEIGVELAPRKPARKNRYIFRKQPRKWPLTFGETWQFLRGILLKIFRPSRFNEMSQGQTVEDWAEGRFGPSTVQWLVAPALQGIYAGNVRRMSASLVLKGLLEKRSRKGVKVRGTLAPRGGMGDLVAKLYDWLLNRGVSFRFSTSFDQIDSSKYSAVVIATSAFDLEKLNEVDSRIPSLQVEALPLATATLFFEDKNYHIDGFGCLFPQKEGFYGLGVLFNSSVFEGRVASKEAPRSETWILGGAFRKDICRFSDDELLRQIQEDRKRLYQVKEVEKPVHMEVTRWPQALPHLNVDLEKQLSEMQVGPGVYMSGNYLGRIGLSQIVARNKMLALQIKKELS